MIRQNLYRYHAFGLRIASEIPMLSREPEETGHAPESDIVIEYGSLDELWAEWSAESEDKYLVKGNDVLFRIAETAVYYVQNGRKITVSPVGEPDLDRIRLYLDGYGISALLLQRKVLPIHGTAFVMNGKAYVIIGSSGAGKSTLAKALLDLGCEFLSDDIVPISCAEDGAFVMPALPEQLLWEESVQALGMDSGRLHPLYKRGKSAEKADPKEPHRQKYAVPVRQLCRKPLPLGGMFELVKSAAGTEPSVQEQSKALQLKALLRHTFNRALVPPLGLQEWHFTEASGIARSAHMWRLERPADAFTAPELASLVMDRGN
jgi:Serine kinase of the HPr protein, regulates carbohydrate metabolism